jgi:hypothetical protein
VKVSSRGFRSIHSCAQAARISARFRSEPIRSELSHLEWRVSEFLGCQTRAHREVSHAEPSARSFVLAALPVPWCFPTSIRGANPDRETVQREESGTSDGQRVFLSVSHGLRSEPEFSAQ